MTSAAPHFFQLSILILLLIAAVFAMKYGADIYRTRSDARRQSSADASLEGLRREVSALTERMSAVEKLLREVE